MNFTMQMLPGIIVLLVGAVLTFLSGKFCKKQEDVLAIKLLGVGLAFVGTILVFLT